MKKTTTFTVAAALVLFTAPTMADDHNEGGKMVAHSVSGSHVDGATLWDYNGNKLGTIEKILLVPKQKGALVVIDTSILDDDRKIIVPWTSLQVQTKEGDSDDIIYALDADKAKLTAAPKFTDDAKVMQAEITSSSTYWDLKVERAKDKVKRGVEKASDAVRDAAEEIGDEIEDATDRK